MTIEETEKELFVTVDLENSGETEGKEVVQLYFSSPECGVPRPVRELCGFEKISLRAGERGRVCVKIEKEDLTYYHTGEGRFVLAKGEYTFSVCRDALTPVCSKTLYLNGESLASPYSDEVQAIYSEGHIEQIDDELFSSLCGYPLPKERARLPITMESPFADLSLTFGGRMLSSIVLSVPKFAMWKAKRMKPSKERDNAIKSALFFQRMIEMNTLNGMSMGSGGILPYHIATGFVEIANGHFFRGILKMFRPVRPWKKN